MCRTASEAGLSPDRCATGSPIRRLSLRGLIVVTEVGQEITRKHQRQPRRNRRSPRKIKRYGAALHLSGTAELEWVTPGDPGDDDGTGRRVRFHPEFTSTTRLALATGRDVTYSPHNPALQP